MGRSIMGSSIMVVLIFTVARTGRDPRKVTPDLFKKSKETTEPPKSIRFRFAAARMQSPLVTKLLITTSNGNLSNALNTSVINPLEYLSKKVAIISSLEFNKCGEIRYSAVSPNTKLFDQNNRE